MEFKAGDIGGSLMEYKVGDIVQLISGGPAMTINFINTDTNRIECVWFEGNTQKKDLYTPQALKILQDTVFDI